MRLTEEEVLTILRPLYDSQEAASMGKRDDLITSKAIQDALIAKYAPVVEALKHDIEVYVSANTDLLKQVQILVEALKEAQKVMRFHGVLGAERDIKAALAMVEGKHD